MGPHASELATRRTSQAAARNADIIRTASKTRCVTTTMNGTAEHAAVLGSVDGCRPRAPGDVVVPDRGDQDDNGERDRPDKRDVTSISTHGERPDAVDGVRVTVVVVMDPPSSSRPRVGPELGHGIPLRSCVSSGHRVRARIQ